MPMEPLKSFEDLLERYKAKNARRHVVIVCPDDDHTEYVVRRCCDEDLVDLTLVLDGGESDGLREYLQSDKGKKIKTVICSDAIEAAHRGVQIVYEGQADVLMKGSLSTDTILHAVIDKDGGHGLIEKGKVMSHLTLVESPVYHKMLMFSDAAVIPYPTLEQFDAMIGYDCETWRSIGLETPKIALIHFTEKVNQRFQVTLDYETLKQRATEGRYGSVEIGGPMDVKTACDRESAAIKHISSPVVGNADLLIMPDLEASNTFYKTVSFFGKARMAAMVTGTISPVVVASRADSAESKFYSLILACISSKTPILK